jgi:hypothetical protein
MVLGIIAAIIGGLLLVGAADNNAAPPVDAPPDNCYVCKKLDAWWNDLPWYRRMYSWLWYSINKVACLVKGCG